MKLPSRIELERSVMEESFADFIRGIAGKPGAWPIVETGTDLEWNWHLDAYCLHLEAVARGEIRNFLTNVPPRFAKSVVYAKLFLPWVWTWAPSTKFMFGSYNENFAIRDAVGSRDLILSEWYQERWPHVQLKLDSNRKSDYRNTSGGFRYSFGVQGAATGEGADIIVADDPLNARDMYSDAKRSEANRWWTDVMPTRLNDRRTGRRVVIAQRLHEVDVPSLCINAGYTHLNLPLEYEADRHCKTEWTATDGTQMVWEDPRTQHGEILDPIRFPPDVVEELKDPTKGGVTARVYGTQYQQDPVPDDGTAIFPADTWNLWRSLPTNPDGTLRMPTLRFVSWDMAFSGKPEPGEEVRNPGEPAWTVGQFWYVYGELMYLIDEVRGQWQYARAKKMVETTHAAWCEAHPFAPTAHVVEKKANGYAILSQLHSTIPGIVGFNPDPHGSKTQRAWAAQDRTEARQVYLPADAVWLDEWREELRKFPNGRVKDRVDAFSQAHLVCGGRQWGVA